MEVLFENFRYSRDTKLSIVVVLVGVGVCTVSDVSVNGQGLVAAIVAVCGTALQQHVSIENVSEFILSAAICYILFCWWASNYSITMSYSWFLPYRMFYFCL